MGKGWNSDEAARLFDQKATEHLDGINIPRPHDFLRQLRTYLQRMTDTDRIIQGAGLVRQRGTESGDMLINVGPTIHRSDEPSIRFLSGAQLSFGITLRDDLIRSKLISYRFHLQLLPSSGLKFIRIDLNPPKGDYDPLHIPRSHLHPGFENVHVPFPTMSPLEVLDRIFHVIEPYFTR